MPEENKAVEIQFTTLQPARLEEPANDEVGFKTVVNTIDRIIDNNGERPFVIGINSGWGTGKTFFLGMLTQRLKQSERIVIHFSSWENDFLENALACLIGELTTSLEDVKSSESGQALLSLSGLIGASKFIAVKAIPSLVGQAAKKYLGDDAVAELAKEVTGDATAKMAEELLENHKLLKAGLKEFRDSLTQLAKDIREKTGAPLVICIDELDRCRPNFALEMLESIKHLFEVDNVVFILAYDGKQLANSTQAIYGPSFDGSRYLQRFFNIELGLPDNPLSFIDGEVKRMGWREWAGSAQANVS